MKRIPVLLSVIVLAICFAAFRYSNKYTPTVGLEIGNTAPELKLLNPEGKEIDLSSLRGNMVLVDFWASWCGPCRHENPNVVAAYNNYKSAKFKGAKGFKIYSVSLDNNHDRWVAAIQQDGLVWPDHVITDVKDGKPAAAMLYGVKFIPNNFSCWMLMVL